MITRRTLIGLAIGAVALFCASTAFHNQHHGIGGAVGFVFWWSFLLCVIALVVASARTLVHHSAARRSGREG